MADGLQPDMYERQTRLMFQSARSDPCCLVPKRAELASWHVRYLKHSRLVALLHRYVRLVDNKLATLQSPQRDILPTEEAEAAEREGAQYTTRQGRDCAAWRG